MKAITVVETNDVSLYPPVQTLVKVLLNEGYTVNLIGTNVQALSPVILEAPNFVGYELPTRKSLSVWERARFRFDLHQKLNQYVEECMKTSDCLWTTSMGGMRELGERALKYKNVLQLMELVEEGYLFRQLIRFPIAEYARRSWKNAVAEINRAYIQQVWWDLPKTPYVIPNKPYSLDHGPITPEMEAAIRRMEQEKKKILLYLGYVGIDRDLVSLADAVEKTEDYMLYIVGKAYDAESKKMLADLIKRRNIAYLGGFTAPQHLALVKYARIGLLPYKPQKAAGFSELNALYCAPNKIFEYAGFGVPMVGSNVMGLRLPFEKWNIGRCYGSNDPDSIIHAIEEVDRQHDEMSKNCQPFFDSVNLRKIIVEDILED